MTQGAENFLLLAGGSTDPQLKYFLARAELKGVPVLPLLHAPKSNPAISWDLDGQEMTVDGKVITPKAAFIRQDVFRQLASKRQTDGHDARQWKAAVDGWVISTPSIRRFNRGFIMREAVNKPLALIWAKEFGFRIPRTIIANDIDTAKEFCAENPAIYKPAAGGDLCRELTPKDLKKIKTPSLEQPYIIQEKLVQPEYRVFYIGGTCVSFRLDSTVLDYREDGYTPTLSPVETPDHIKTTLGKLADRLGLDYSASDFKSCPHTGEPVFLEINSNPMFVAFDKAAEGRLTDVMLDWLMQ